MPVKTAGVFSVRGATLSHKKSPTALFADIRHLAKITTKAAYLIKRSGLRPKNLHSRRELSYLKWP